MTGNVPSSPAAGVHTPLAAAQIAQCYQCGKCTAACPLAMHMDAPLTKIIRLLQLGDRETAMRADAIWQCVSCQTCSSGCPQEVDGASVMDALRQISFENGAASPAQERTIVFQKAFLDNIRRNGRLAEIELVAAFKGQMFLRDRSLPFLFRDAGLAARLHRSRKLHLSPSKVRDRAVVARIFERALGGAVA